MSDAKKSLSAVRDEKAKEFEKDVYWADPDLVDSNPAKLYSCGWDDCLELLQERGESEFDEFNIYEFVEFNWERLPTEQEIEVATIYQERSAVQIAALKDELEDWKFTVEEMTKHVQELEKENAALKEHIKELENK